MIDIPATTLDREFGRETMRRARAYAEAGNVVAHEVRSSHGGIDVAGTVRGTRPTPYEVNVRIDEMVRGVEIWSVCDCPVSLRCKHAAAVLVVAGRDPRTAGSPRWARDLDQVLTALEVDPPGNRTTPIPLALQIDVKVATSRWQQAPVRTLRLQPLQEGKLGKWIKTGVSWSQVAGLRYRADHDPVQVEVLAELATMLGSSYGGLPDLVRTSRSLWPMLNRLRDAGIALVPGPGAASVELSDQPVAMAADLRLIGQDPPAGPDEGNLEVSFGVGATDGSDRSWPASGIELLGSPAHGVALLMPAEAPNGRVTPHFAVTLAPLRRVLPDSVRGLLHRGGPLLVPEDQRDEFMDDYLPRLRRQLSTASSDDSVSLPREAPPRLVFELGWVSPGRVAGAFTWAYRLGRNERRFGIDSGAGLADVRRTDLEAGHLAGLGLDAPTRELLCDASGRLRAESQWVGQDLIRFVEEVLPELRAHQRIDVEETGDQPDYRAAVGDPEISFELADRAAGARRPAGEQPEGAPRRTDWLDLEVMIRVDGEQVPLGMVLAALTRGDELVFLNSGLHVRADHPAFDRLADLVSAARELVDQPRDGLRVARHDLDTWAELDELGVVDTQAEEWLRAARALRGIERLPEVADPGLATELRSYQHDGFLWLAFLWQAGLGGILADDMGLGKTLQALALITHARAKGAAPFLVVAPTSVVTAWASEAARHTPDLDVRAVAATAARRDQTLQELAAGADVVVTSYTLLRLEAEGYAALTWGGLVLDEAQQIKNHQAKAYRAVRGINAPFRLALTGTPFENRLIELWSLLSVVAPGLYPSPQRFREVVVRPIEAGDPKALDRFRRRIAPFLLRRTKDLVAADMPPKQEQVLEVTLSARHRRIYDTHLQRERQTVLGLVDDFDQHRIAIFRSLTRLRQLSLDAALLDPVHDQVGSAKIEALVEHLLELAAEGHRALVFSQFTTFLRRVRERLEHEGIASCYLDGRTRNRQRVIEEFKGGDAPAFLISLKAGGVGLTLTEADYVFVLDPWWNPAVEAQAVDRTHRIGQLRPVMVYRLVATDTIEEKVVALKERKAALFAQVLDGGRAADAAIAADDVRALFED